MMFRMWMKIFKENRLLQDTVITLDDPDMMPDRQSLSGCGRCQSHF